MIRPAHLRVVVIEEDGMRRVEIGRVRIGQSYEYVSESGNGTDRRVKGERYAPVEFIREARTNREEVLYLGLTGPDAGHYFSCTLHDFGLRFRPVQQQEAASPAG